MRDPIRRRGKLPTVLFALPLFLLAPLACIGPPKLAVTYADFLVRAGPVPSNGARVYVFSLPHESAGGIIEIDGERIGVVYGGGICSFVVASTHPGRHRVASITNRWGHESASPLSP